MLAHGVIVFAAAIIVAIVACLSRRKKLLPGLFAVGHFHARSATESLYCRQITVNHQNESHHSARPFSISEIMVETMLAFVARSAFAAGSSCRPSH